MDIVKAKMGRNSRFQLEETKVLVRQFAFLIHFYFSCY